MNRLSARRLKPRQQERQAHLRGLPTPPTTDRPVDRRWGEPPQGGLAPFVAANSFARLASGSWLRRQRLGSIALVCSALLVACRARVPAPVPPETALTPDAVYAAVRRQEAQVRALRSRFSARVDHAGEVRRADGVLLVKKPDRFRLRLLAPFGPTVFDYTSWDDHDRMQLPLEGKQFNDAEIADHAPFSPADLRVVFLGTDGGLQCRAQGGAAETVVDCRDHEGAVARLIHVQTATRRVAQEVHFAAGQPRLIMRFDDYRHVDSVDLPFQISLTYPEKNVHLEITVRSYEVNPTLADELFGALQPSSPRS